MRVENIYVTVAALFPIWCKKMQKVLSDCGLASLTLYRRDICLNQQWSGSHYLNSQDTGCLDYVTVSDLLTCHDKNALYVLPDVSKSTNCWEYQFAQSLTEGGVDYLEKQSIGFRGVFIPYAL